MKNGFGRLKCFTKIAAFAINPLLHMNGPPKFVDAGGLTSYGAKIANGYQQAGIYVGQILRGASYAASPATDAFPTAAQSQSCESDRFGHYR